MIEVPKFKASLIQTGSSRAFLVPAKIREDYGIEEGVEYWVELRLVRAEGGDADAS